MELDDDHPDGAAPTPLVEEREKVDVSLSERKNSSAEAATPENPPSLLGFKRPVSSALNQNSGLVTSDGPVVAEKSTGFSFPKFRLYQCSCSAYYSSETVILNI